MVVYWIIHVRRNDIVQRIISSFQAETGKHMNGANLDLNQIRRTTADELFELLRSDIEKLVLVPGTKLSEANVARQYSVSRQPVREALIRLDHLKLVEIQPQKATIVRRISRSAIKTARFTRLAVELEIARRACGRYQGELDEQFHQNLSLQGASLEKGSLAGFNTLDKNFHGLLCSAADCLLAMDIILQCKAQVDRLCLLSLTNVDAARQILSDHHAILKSLQEKDVVTLCELTERHQHRLDSTIDHVQLNHQDYFDD